MTKKKKVIKKKSHRSASALAAKASSGKERNSTVKACEPKQEATAKDGKYYESLYDNLSKRAIYSYADGFNEGKKQYLRQGFYHGVLFMLGINIAIAILAACFYWG